jgi:DNA-binding MarR family transcriptional regulator
MYQIQNSPSRYYQVMKNYQEAQLLFGAIRLNIFSYLDTPVTAEEVSKELHCEARQAEVLLLALVSCGLIGRQGDHYANMPETKEFLSRSSQVFLGESLLFRAEMTSLDGLEQRLLSSQPMPGNSYDFSQLAQVTVPEIYAGRVQAFMKGMSELYPDSNRPLRILDLGGGTGIYAIEFARQFKNSKATVFETAQVGEITKEIIKQHHAQEQVDVLTGNFNTDSLEGPYDLIIASGILNFVDGDLSCFLKKLSSSLQSGGHLLVIGQFADHKYSAPPNMLGWLSGFLDGVPLPPDAKEIEEAMKQAGFHAADSLNDAVYQGQLYQKDCSTSLVSSGDVLSSFMELTEQITNSRTNILEFGGEDMTFYRGEIHMIKTIGDCPGIYSAELARKFGITRPVVHKTIQKLAERGLVTKSEDEEDKKRYRLYLTEKGMTAYSFHANYHEENDKQLIGFLKDMPGEQLTAVKGFLDHAIGLIQNHA